MYPFQVYFIVYPHFCIVQATPALALPFAWVTHGFTSIPSRPDYRPSSHVSVSWARENFQREAGREPLLRCALSSMFGPVLFWDDLDQGDSHCAYLTSVCFPRILDPAHHHFFPANALKDSIQTAFCGLQAPFSSLHSCWQEGIFRRSK